MSDIKSRIAGLSPEKRALLERRMAAGATRPSAERPPVAVIGMGCRLPGANSPAAFWQLMLDGQDAITEVPPDRWNAASFFDADPGIPGKMATRWGGFLNRLDGFDAEFFGIAPREAERMDPQQRLLLETACEALETAGLPLASLAGRRVGVFVGVHSMSSDYYQRQLTSVSDIDPYTSTGAAHSILANRLSYLFDFRGPSVAVDTACSSSLVAVHLACQSIRAGECDIAIAAGVNLMLSPEASIAFSKLRMMAADGRCKTFDAAADGFVRGEGCGVVVLRRLDQALEHGDPIAAVIRGTAVNQDGATNGLTAPNGLSQREVMRLALADAALPPERITFVETHGTGTALGDPIEVEALADVLGGASGIAPCVLGAVKTNIGHLEAAAGIAGLIKTVLCLQHRHIPGNLHFRSLNPHISFGASRLKLPGSGLPWLPDSAELRAAGVSSFGFGGTNAHIVLEEFAPAALPNKAGKPSGNDAVLPLPISARTPEALRALSRETVRWMTGSASAAFDDRDIAYTAGVRRNHHESRRMVVGKSRNEWSEALTRSCADAGSRRTSEAILQPWPGLVFVYSGQGPQWAGMGQGLHAREKVFRDALDQCRDAFRRHAPWDLLEELARPEESSRLNDTEIAQPAIFAIQYALTRQCRAWGIEPDAVIGHSAGEVAAAWAAGVLTFDEAARLVVRRGALMMRAAGQGAMAAVELPADQAQKELDPHEGRIDLGAVNSPTSTVLSGEPQAIDAVVAALKSRGIFAKRLCVPYAFHSRQMEALQPELIDALAGLEPSDPVVPIASTVTGGLMHRGEHDAHYWARNMRETVRFADAIQTLADAGHRVFLELGPHPILTSMIARCGDHDLIACGSLHKGRDEQRSLLEAVGTLYEAGLPVDFARFHQAQSRTVPLPTYPWQRSRFWFDATPARQRPEARRLEHPLLGERLSSAVPLFECQLGTNDQPWLADHRVFGRPVVPAAAYIEMIRAACAAADVAVPAMTGLTFHQPLVLPSDGCRTLQISVAPDDHGGADVQIFSRAEDDGHRWTRHVSATAAAGVNAAAGAGDDAVSVQARCRPVSLEDHYAELSSRGLDIGSSLRGVEQLWLGETEALGRVAAVRTSVFGVDPVWLDACLQPIVAAAGVTGTRLLAGIERFATLASTGAAAWSHASIRTAGSDVVADLRVFGDDGTVVLEAQGLLLKPLAAGDGAEAEMTVAPASYEVRWREQPLDTAAEPAQSAPADIAAAVLPHLESLRAAHDFDTYEELVPKLESLSLGYVLQAFENLGWRWTIGHRVRTEQLSAQLGIVPAHRRLFTRLCEMLQQEGYLRAVGDELEVLAVPPGTPDLRERFSQLRRAYPASEAELDLLQRCGSELGDVLCGRRDPIAILFPGGSFEAIERIYRDSPFSRVDNRLLQQAIARAVTRPDGRRLRILEVGAGTGGSTTYVVPVLPPGTEYVFTDLSQLFLTRARNKFKAADLRYELLDIERNPDDQGFSGRQFDIVIAANVLHATADLRRTVGHVRQLLAPGGLLMLLEVTRPQRWIDLTFGLTDGWWRFADADLRPTSALLSPAAWISMLREAGFASAATVPEPGDAAQESVIVAQTPAAAGQSTAATRWVIMRDGCGVAEALTTRMRSAGHEPVVVAAGTALADEAVAALAGEEARAGGVIDLTPLDARIAGDIDTPRVLHDQEQLSVRLSSLARAVAAVPPARLWVVTSAAQAVPERQAATVDPAQASVWGLGRVMALEHGHSWGGMIDADGNAAAIADRVWMELGRETAAEDQVVWRGGSRYVPRLVRLDLAAGTPEWRRDGAYLITGGLGGVGLILARWLAAAGVRHLVLTGRTGLGPVESGGGEESARRRAGVAALEAEGVTVTVAAVDAADEPGMRALFARFGDSLPPLRGIFHAAADLSAMSPADARPEDFGTMFRAKIGGAWTLHRLSLDHDLDHFVLFSSTTALLGAVGLGHYAAGNTFMDALAHARHTAGRPALSVNWGTWETMRTFSDTERSAVEQFGLRPMDSERALTLMAYALVAEAPQVMIAAIDWGVLKSAYEARRARPMLHELETPQAPAVAASDGLHLDVRRRLAESTPSTRVELLLELIRVAVAEVLGYSAGRPLDVRHGLFDLGLDSLMAVDLRVKLETLAGRKLPAGLTFNYPSIEALTGYFSTEIFDVEGTRAAASAPMAVPAPVAVATPFDNEAPRSMADTLAMLDAELAAIDELVRD